MWAQLEHGLLRMLESAAQKRSKGGKEILVTPTSIRRVLELKGRSEN